MNSAVVKIFAFLVSSLFIFSSCNNPTSIGGNLQPKNLKTVFTDTLTLQTSTVFVDSINTTNRELLLCGQYKDPKLGKITASAYFTIRPFNQLNEAINTNKILSVVLSLPVNLSYGDTTQVQTIRVHKLLSSIEPEKIYSNKDALAYEASPIGTFTFKGSEATVFRRLDIPLDATFQTQLIGFINGYISPNDLSQIALDAFTKGLVIVPDNTDNAAIWGFRVTGAVPAAIIVRYLDSNDAEQTFRIDVRNAVSASDITNKRYNSLRFNRVGCDRTGTLLSSLSNSYQTLPSASTNEEVFIQEALGIRIKVSFPYLGKLVENQTIAINRADLVLSVLDLPDPFLKTPRRLEALLLSETQRPIPYILAFPDLGVEINDTLFSRLQTEGANPFALGSVQSVLLNALDNTYSFQMTTYLQYVLNKLNPRYSGVNKLDNYSFHINSDLANTSMYRAVLGGAKHPSKAMKLRVFYTIAQ